MNLLIDASELQLLQAGALPPLVFDCRFELTNPSAGYASYLQGHIPHAIYVDLGKDLAGPTNGSNGRHPLPTLDAWEKTYANLGITPDRLVVVYDAQNGMFAARMWWMLQATGHTRVRLLNGGYASWQSANFAMDTTDVKRQTTERSSLKNYAGLVKFDEVLKNINDADFQILDARSSDRYRGENETLDPVGGRIPGAHNRCFKDNFESSGKFKSAEVLNQEFKSLMAQTNPDTWVHQCGSGVTACVNLFAMELAKLSGSRLYAGSWSEWCADPHRPVERG